MVSIKPSRLKISQIWEKSEEFRNKYADPPDQVPFPIDDIVESYLRIQPQPIPRLLEEYDIDGFLSADLRVIYIDQTIYDDPRYQYRRRFTFAHEVGHLVLHGEQIKQCSFDTVEEWIQFRSELPEDDLRFFEFEGYEFAGRLLVPKNRLIQALNSLSDKVAWYRDKFPNNNNELLIEYLASSVNNLFDVSDGVILRRIRNERIWDDLKFST